MNLWDLNLIPIFKEFILLIKSKFIREGYPFVDKSFYYESNNILIIDPSNSQFKNVTPHCSQIYFIQKAFGECYNRFTNIKKSLFDHNKFKTLTENEYCNHIKSTLKTITNNSKISLLELICNTSFL